MKRLSLPVVVFGIFFGEGSIKLFILCIYILSVLNFDEKKNTKPKLGTCKTATGVYLFFIMRFKIFLKIFEYII